MSLFRRLGSILVLAFFLSSPARAEAFGIKSFRTYASPADGVSRSYAVYTPKGYASGASSPAILFLHGRGGSALSFQDPRYLDAADASGTVLIFWQGRLDADGLLSTYYVDGANGVPDETDVLACLDDALSHFAIDPARVHLVGFSQGGKGALLVGLENPSRFASIVDGSGPSDAFEGQRWSPSFPDFRDAAGGDPSAGGPVLARWYAQSPRFLLPNARNVPVLFAHGELDGVVPNSTFVFPYMNTHHAADTPGFTDAWGRALTMKELHEADPDGYAYVTRYVAGVGHDELGVLDPVSLFSFVADKTLVARPSRVVGTTYDAKERALYWTRLARAEAPDGRPAAFSAELISGAGTPGVAVTGAGAGQAAPLVTIDLQRAGLDAAAPFQLVVKGRLTLRVVGVPGTASVTHAGAPVPGTTLDAGVLTIPLTDWGATPATLKVAAVSPAVLGSDLLAPALVAADGLNGARFETELVLGNPGDSPSEVEALFLDGSGRKATLVVPARSTRLYGSAELFGMLGAQTNVAAPLRLRTLSGPPVLASERVFNVLPSGGTYGLSFPVASGAASVLAAGEATRIVGPAADERMNVSVFAPFEAASVAVAGATHSLAPLQRLQLGPFTGGADSSIAVSVISGRVQVYATTISNSPTNDPFRSPAAPLSSAARDWTVPAVASATGRFGASFSSDLALTSTSASAVDATLTFRSHDGASASASVHLAPLETRVVGDVLGSLFPAFAPGYGALTIHATDPLLVSDVTRANAASGPASEDVACVRAGEEATSDSPVALVGLAESSRARTNVTLVNVGPAATVALRLLAEDGDRGTVTLSLGAGEFRQLDSVAGLFSVVPTDASTLVITPGAGARVVVSGARIDDVTNDPTGLAPVPLATH